MKPTWQQAGDWSTGDFNDDDVVNIIDLGIMASSWSDPPVMMVPEPMTLCLLALGGLSLIRTKRK